MDALGSELRYLLEKAACRSVDFLQVLIRRSVEESGLLKGV